MSTQAPAPPPDPTARLIDEWFPCQQVDEAVKAPTGSGRSEKALFTWFASRPIAQARAAVLTTLLSDNDSTRADIKTAVLTGDPTAMQRLRDRITDEYPRKPPVVLDIFSGRGIIPLEAARCGATAIGTDLSPVATLAGLLLADYPLRDWSKETPLPYTRGGDSGDLQAGMEEVADPLFSTSHDDDSEPRLVRDVGLVLAEVQRRVAEEMAPLYPGNPLRDGAVPWAYLWAVTMTCDRCKRRFPLLGSLVLRHPYKKTRDLGQHLRVDGSSDELRITVHDGVPSQVPPFAAAAGKRGKSARCPFDNCGNTHSLDVIKAKGWAGDYEDLLIAVAEVGDDGAKKLFRTPRSDEVLAARGMDLQSLPKTAGMVAVPDERIPEGNSNTIQASIYGYSTYGSLMNDRQLALFASTARHIDEVHAELATSLSEEYAQALAGYAAANLVRQVKHSTRGAGLRAHGKPDGTAQNRCQIDHVFSSQSIIKYQFDYLEASCALGPGTWSSVSKSLLNALSKVTPMRESTLDNPGKFRVASAVSLPFRDSTVDAVVTDPPYYDMITYSDSSDLFYVWLKRSLGEVLPDLFAPQSEGPEGLQDKSDEIIVKSKGRKVDGEHRTREFYESMLSRSFTETRRVLKPGGRLTVIFGHSDPDAWKRLLTALTDAGFVVTSSWPSRTETAVTGVATISVTVSIGCKVAPAGRHVGIAAQVDAAVLDEVRDRCREWDRDGLALEDQQMASYGAALAIVGQYEKVITPDGETVPLEHYMTLARKAVRSAVALRLDSLPLETFDPLTRFAVFWQELYGRSTVPKGESRFFAQSDELRLEDLRGRILNESSKGFALQYVCPESISPASSRFEVVRGMAAAWSSGSEAVAQVIEATEMSPTDQHLWAVADWVASKLPSSDPISVALTAIKRNKAAIQASVNTTLQLGSDA